MIPATARIPRRRNRARPADRSERIERRPDSTGLTRSAASTSGLQTAERKKAPGSLIVAEWNHWMRIVQDLRDDAMAGRIKVAELREGYDGICNHRAK